MPGVPETVISALRSAGTHLTLAEIRTRLVESQGIDEVEAKQITGASLDSALEAHPQVESRVVQIEDAEKLATGSRRSRSRFSRSVKTYAWQGPSEDVASLHAEEGPIEADDEHDGLSAEPGLSSDSSLDDLVTAIRQGHKTNEIPEFEVAASILGSASDRQLTEAAVNLRETTSLDAPLLLLATPRRSRAIEKSVIVWGRSEASEYALAGVLGWLSSSRTQSKQLTFAADYLENVERSWGPPVASACLSGLIKTVGDKRTALLRIAGRTDYAGLQQAAEDSEIATLRRALQSESMGPGRRRILWAMMQVVPDTVDAREAWLRTTLDDLIEMAASTRERTMLARPWVQENVVRPRVRKDLEDGDRFALSRVLGYPTAIFNTVGAEKLEQALLSAARNDALLSDAVNVLSQNPEIQRLSREVESAREHVGQTEAQLGALRARLEESEASTVAWRERALRAENEQVEAGTHEIRQAHVDGMKALAESLAAVDRLRADASPETVLYRLLTTARQHGVSPIGSRGETVPFDPSLHHALTDVSVDQPVLIHERGFLLNEAGGETVLIRATVSAGTDQ